MTEFDNDYSVRRRSNYDYDDEGYNSSKRNVNSNRARRSTNSRNRKRRKKRRSPLIHVFIVILVVGAITCGTLYIKNKGGLSYIERKIKHKNIVEELGNTNVPDYVQVDILTMESNSRRGEKLEDYKSIVIHYVGNPGSSAQANHRYYSNPESEVSSHFLIGLDGEIIQCIPLDEKSSASNWRNADTISIEVCHPDESGSFNASSYSSLVKLTAWLVELGDLDPNVDIIRHYDITGKECPKYYVDHPEEWARFKQDVANYKKILTN